MQTLIHNGTVVTCDDADTVFEGGSVLLDEGEILFVGNAREAEQKAKARGVARWIDAEGAAILPGFVQGHIHLCQVLLRGMAEDLALLDWLKNRIWPLEAAHDEKSLRASAELGLAEIMRAGTTSILDMGTVHHHDVVMEACLKSGIRAASGKAMMDQGEGVPRGLRENTKSSLDESDALRKRWHGKGEGRIRYAYAPRFILSCSEKLIRDTATRAREADVIVHTHVAEQVAERKAVFDALGDQDVAVLAKWGVEGERAVLAHGVHLTPKEMKELGRAKTRIVHCPSANLKLASGIADIVALDAAKVQLALGADGAPCNNRLDPWSEMRLAGLLTKVKRGPAAVSAKRIVRLATIDGARALGLGEISGSLEVGKRADLVVAQLDSLEVEPGGDVFSKLVYAASREHVRHVFVDGEWLVKDARHVRFDEERVAAIAREQGQKLLARADIS